MRKFTVECKDDKTGLSMVLSECSYNTAMDWLQKTLRKYDVDIYRTEVDFKGLVHIWTGKPKAGTDYTGRPEVFFEPCRKYFYDEERGYLLGE